MSLNPIKYSNFWNAVVTSTPVKRMLELSLSKCVVCGREVLDTALDTYAGLKVQECGKCRIYSRIIIFWIEFLRRSLSVDKKKVIKILSDQYARRGIKSMVNTFIHFGIKRPLAVYSPFLVVWDYTRKCNLNCRHCYSNARAASEKELTTEESLSVVDQLADFGVVALAFSGGEPLARRDFFHVAEHAVKSGLYVSLATNGTLIDKHTARRLSQIGLHYVEISIDGASSNVHDEFRGLKGAFEKAIQGLRYCVEEGLCVSIAVTATKMNFNQIPKILELAEEIGADRFALFNFVPTGRGSEMVSLDLSPEEREELLIFLLGKLLSSSKVTMLATAPQLARVAVSQQQRLKGGEIYVPMAHMQTTKVSSRALALADFIGGCGAGRLYCSISPEGDVQPCVFLPIKVGNLRNDCFESIWLKSPVFNILRNRENLRGACGNCTFKYVCGGCRARAYAYHEDILASDPGCILANRYSKET
ncbi:MAG: radical SAM protein [Candidatus Bathyarchaeota archaeon]|nr:radical SAM protein [Candidatus Bathyarchaeota archaeon]MCX8177507.1 radical SAM protein [Candidatus Bathyarchaeota archaeon]MDW8194174.1 radical SAM protein [Nitrososphaerota archaeon]